jgi:membrane-associated phospholipid phosphatase
VHRREAGLTLSRPLLAVTALCLASFLVMALIAAAQQFSELDHHARALVQRTQLPLMDFAMLGVSSLGEDYGVLALITAGVALLWTRSRRWAVALPLLMAGTGALQLVAKWAVDRPRPNLAAWGFPSGHVLSLVVFFGLMAYLLSMSTLTARRRRLGFASCLAIVLAVGFSRLYLEAHWVSDVAGGFTLGIAYLLPSICLVEALGRRRLPFTKRALGSAQKRTCSLPAMNGEDSTPTRFSVRSE